MKQTVKRMIALLLALSMCFSLLSTGVWASDTSGDGSGDVSVLTDEPPEADPEESAPAGEPQEVPKLIDEPGKKSDRSVKTAKRVRKAKEAPQEESAPASKALKGTETPELAVQSTYDVWVGGIRVTDVNKSDVLGAEDEGATVQFTPASGDDPAKLTLNGATITGGHLISNLHNAAVCAKGDLTINVTGDSTVTGPNDNLNHSFGIFVMNVGEDNPGNLTITGTGKLTATGGNATPSDLTKDSMGVMSFAGNITVETDSTLIACGGQATGYRRDAYAQDFTVNGTLTATGGTASNFSCGVESYFGVTVNNGGTLTATGGASNKSSGV